MKSKRISVCHDGAGHYITLRSKAMKTKIGIALVLLALMWGGGGGGYMPS
jgi:hypothetical protein